MEHRPSPFLPVAPTSKNLVLHCEDHGGINATDDSLSLVLWRDCDLLGAVVALQCAQPKPTWQEEQSRQQLMAAHTLTTTTPRAALTQLLQEPSLGSQKAAKPKAQEPWYAAKQLQLFHTHPPWHIWRGLWASSASKGVGTGTSPVLQNRHHLPLSPLPQANTSRSLETART